MRLPPTIESQGFVACWAFGAIVLGPAAGYLLAFHPDWAFAYWLAPDRFGTAPHSALVLGSALTPVAGYRTSLMLAASPPRVPIIALAGLPAFAAAALLLGHAGRLGVSGTYAQFHGDFGLEPIAGSALGYSVLCVVLVVLFGAAWTLGHLAGLSREVSD
jgi:hypothetical protein